MLARWLSQLVLTAAFLQIFPQDGKTLEQRAGLPTSGEKPVVLQAVRALQTDRQLPESRTVGPRKNDHLSAGMVTTASSVILADRESGTVLFEKDPYVVRAIGSITKLMTALVFFDQKPDLTAKTVLLEEDIRDGGRLYLALNDPVVVEDLVRASLIGSDNSATITLVRTTGLSEDDFIAQMNAKAVELGMTETTFVEPTGLSPFNRSTAWDLLRLLDAALDDERIRAVTTTPWAIVKQESGRTVEIPTTDALLESFVNQPPFRLLGGKTGYLPEAGYGIALGAKKEGEGEVMVVVLGSPTADERVLDVKGLIDWTYRVWDWP